MTRDELRKIFAEAERRVCNPEVYGKIVAKLTDSAKAPAENQSEFALRVNLELEREILFEVLAQVLDVQTTTVSNSPR